MVCGQERCHLLRGGQLKIQTECQTGLLRPRGRIFGLRDSPDGITADRHAFGSCGVKFTLVLCCDGRVFAFGHGNSGQLGLGEGTAESTSPRQITALPLDVSQVACGDV